MSIQSIEQKRAKYALEKVQTKVLEIFTNNNDVKKKIDNLKARTNEMPAMIQMNGLGQTVAFYLSKGKEEQGAKNAHLFAYELLSDWLEKEMRIYDKPLINGITEGDMTTYRMAQAEAQALLIWVKKFSKAFCKE